MTNEEMLDDAIQRAEQSFSAKNFAKFWASAEEVSECLKSCRLQLQPEKYDEIRNWLKNRRKCAKSEMAAQKKAIRNESMAKRQLVETTIRQAISETVGATTAEDLTRASALLIQASEWTRDGCRHGLDPGYMVNLGSGRLTEEDRRWCSDLWQEAKDDIGFRRQAVHDKNYQYYSGQAARACNEVHAGNYGEAKNIIREAQKKLRRTSMSDTQFQAVRMAMNEAWNMVASHQRQADREWKRKDRGYSAQLEAHREKRRRNKRSRTDDFANTAQGWIDEKRTKIGDIESTSSELIEKINEATDRLSS